MADGRPAESRHAVAEEPVRRGVHQFEEFYREHRPKLVVFLLYLGADQQTALDISQEVMIKAYRGWSDIRSPKTWVRVVASRDWGKVMAKVEVDVPAPTEVATPLDHVLRLEEHARVLAVFRELPPRQRQIMAWTYDGYAPAEIADILSITGEAVRASLRKARRALVPPDEEV